MLKLRPCFLFLAGAICCSAYGASFDCSRAKRPVEQAICSTPALSAADSHVASLYRQELERLSSRSVGEARVDQLQWLAWIQQVCRIDTQKLPAAAGCLQPLYEDRATMLRLAVIHQGGLSFFTRTQYLAWPEKDPHGGPKFPGFGTLQAAWPKADTGDEGWAGWNRAVEDRLLRLASHRPDNTTSIQAAGVWQDSLAGDADTSTSVKLKSIEHDRVTATVQVEGMAHGGAHGYEVAETMTWLLAARRELSADDVFRPGSAWQSALARQAWEQLQTGAQHTSIYSAVNGPEAKPLIDVVSNPANWTLEHDGLHISYPEYTVSPRVAPPDDAVVPWSSLRDVLQTGFETP